MRRLQVAQAAVLHVRDVAAGELELEAVAVVGRPEEHGLLPEGHTLVTVPQHRVADVAGLGALVGAGCQDRAGAAGADGPQVLGERARRLGQHGVGGVEDGLGRPVVLLEGDDPRSGVPARELVHVLGRRSAKGIDRLGIVAHRAQVAVRSAEGEEDVALDGVGVLVLVDENVVELLSQRGRAVGRQQRAPVEQQVVVVEQ